MKITSHEIEVARAAAIFEGLEEQSVEQILKEGDTRYLSDGAFFFLEEDPAVAAYVLLEGKTKLTQTTAEGKQVLLGYLSPGRSSATTAFKIALVTPP